MREQGFDVLLVALRHPQQPATDDEVAQLAAATLYPPQGSVRLLLAQLVAAFTRPAGYLCALRIVISRSLRVPAEAGHLLGSLLLAGYFAVKLRHSLGHICAHSAARPATVAWLLAEIRGSGYSLSCRTRDLLSSQPVALTTKIAEAELVTVCSDYAGQRLLRDHRLVAENKLHLIYDGLDVARYVPGPSPPSSPVPLLLSVGQLVERKGYPFLLRAASLLRSREAQFRLVIVGDGPQRRDLLRLAAGLGLQQTVEFRGVISRRDLMDLYHQADVFVLASVVAADGDRDGLPDVLLEALAMRIPTVASDISAIPELIEPHKTGLLATPGDVRDLADKLEIALYDEGFRERVSLLGREKVSKYFDVRRNTAALAQLFSKVTV